uniref:Uncharacterized protein n=1 Tax=Lepeophtheirus salmonis TaxID=72036 RepID=A0A0K2T4I1_LEPSM
MTCDSTWNFSLRMFPLHSLMMCRKLQECNRHSEIFGGYGLKISVERMRHLLEFKCGLSTCLNKDFEDYLSVNKSCRSTFH